MDTPVQVTDALYNNPVIRISDGKDVSISLVTLRTFPNVLAYAQTILDDLKVVNGMPTIDLNNYSELLHLIAKHTEPTFEMVALLSSLSKEELLDIPLDDAVRVITTIVDKNKNFFLEKVLPVLERTVEGPQ